MEGAKVWEQTIFRKEEYVLIQTEAKQRLTGIEGVRESEGERRTRKEMKNAQRESIDVRADAR